VFGAGGAWLIGRNITKPLIGLHAKMARIADGDYAVEITKVGAATSSARWAYARRLARESRGHAAPQIRAGSTQVQGRGREESALDNLANTFEAKVQSIVDAVAEAAQTMQTTARSLSKASDATREQTLAVATTASQATTNVETVAASSEELSASISEIGRQVVQAAGVSRQAEEQSRKTDETVAGLSNAAQKIGEVIELINSIASQTNLLALNATSKRRAPARPARVCCRGERGQVARQPDGEGN